MTFMSILLSLLFVAMTKSQPVSYAYDERELPWDHPSLLFLVESRIPDLEVWHSSISSTEFKHVRDTKKNFFHNYYKSTVTAEDWDFLLIYCYTIFFSTIELWISGLNDRGSRQIVIRSIQSSVNSKCSEFDETMEKRRTRVSKLFSTFSHMFELLQFSRRNCQNC